MSSNWDGSGVRAARDDLDSLQTDLQRIADTRATAQVGVNVDRSDLDGLKEELEQIGEMRVTATVGVKIDDTGLNEFRAELDQVGRTRAQATVGANVEDQNLREFQVRIDQVGSMHVTANVNVNVDTTRLDAAMAELAKFSGERATAHAIIEVNTDGLTEANLLLDRFGARRVTAHADIDTSGAVLGMNSLSSSTARLSSSIFSLTTIVVALGPALIPIGAAALTAAGAFVAMGAAAGGAAGIVGLAFVAALKSGGAAAKAMKSSIDDVKTSFTAWGSQVAPMLAGPFRTALEAVAGSFSKLTPLVRALTPMLNQVADAFKKWTDNNLQSWIGWLSTNGVPILGNFVIVGKNLGATFGIMLRAFAPMAQSMSEGLAKISTELKNWAQDGGFTRFIDYVKQNSGQVQAFFSALFSALKNVSTAMAGMAGPSLILATALARLVAATPPSVIQAIAYAFIAWRTAMVGLLIIETVTTITAGLSRAIGVLRAAWILLDLAFALSPIGVIITGIVALGAAIALVATKTTFFQTAWKATWSAIQVASDAIWTAMKVSWTATVAAISTVWNTVGGAFAAAWKATWNGIQIAGEAIWNAMKASWSATVNFLASTWNTVGNAISASWKAIWSGMQTAAVAIWNALRDAWAAFSSAMKTAMTGMLDALSTAWSAAWNAMKTAAVAVWNALRDAWATFSSAMKTAMSGMLDALKTGWSAAWTAIKTAAIAIWDALRSAFGTFSSAMKTALSGMLDAMKTAWSATWNAIKSAVVAIWDALRSAFGAFSSAMKTATTGMLNAIKSTWSATWNAIKDITSSVWDGIKHVTADAVNDVIGIMDGIIGAWNKITSAVGLKKLNVPEITYRAKFASGGAVSGPGTAKSDSIPAMLSNGEYVMNAAAVNHYGMGNMHAMNERKLANGGPVYLAGGGSSGGDSSGGLGSTSDHDAPAHATAQQQAAANVPGVYLKGGNQEIGDSQYSHLDQVQKDLVDAAGVHKVGKSILGQIGGAIEGVAKGALSSVGDIVKMGEAALGYIGKAAFDAIFNPLIKPLEKVTGAGVVGQFVVEESKNIADGMLDLLIKKDSSAGSVGGKIPEGEHKAVIDAALKAAGVPPPGSQGEWEAGMNTLITRESAWNAGATNHSDSNAAAGHPSTGLAQTIPSTFAAYHVAGTSSNINDPVANVAAAIRYIVSRYGNISNVQQANASKPPQGYASGTPSAAAGTALVGENGPELINFGGGEQVIPNGQTQDILSGGSLSPDWSKAWNDAATIMQNSTAAMQNGAGTFMTNIRKTFQDQGNTLSTEWQKDWEQNKTIAVTTWDSTTNTGNTFTDSLKKTFTDVGTQMQQDWQKSLDTTNQDTTKYWTDTEGQFSTGGTWLTNTFFPPVNDFLTKTFPASFVTGAADVATGWNTLKTEVRDPVAAIVDTVYNKGLRGVWNVIAGAFGAKTLDEFTMPAFATGGEVNGPGNGTSDSIVAKLSHGEHVWTAAETKAAGGHNAVASMRSQALGGGGVRTMGTNGRYAAGGGVDTTQAAGDAASSGTDTAKLAGLTLGGIATVANPMIESIAKAGKAQVDAMIPGSPDLESGMDGAIANMASSVEAWITSHDISPTMGGANDKAAQAWADAQVGKPYSLGGDFGATFDCSQYMSGIAKSILGETPTPWFTTFAFNGATAPEGFEQNLKAPFMIGVTNEGVGHTAGTLNGKNYEATPPAVRSGPSARGYDDSMFPMQYGFKPSVEAIAGAVTDSNHLAIIDAALAAAGVPPPGDKASWENGMNTLITRESAWDPNAINLTDSNATAGHPSQGLAQTIPSTFNAYHVPGTSTNILDPVANVAAAIRYIVATYGNITNVQQANASLPPLGYWNGTKSAASGWATVGERGPEMMNFGGGGQQVRSFKDSLNDFRDSSRGSSNGDGAEDHSVTIHEGGIPVQITVQGNCDAETAKTLQSPEFLNQISTAIIAGVGRKNG